MEKVVYEKGRYRVISNGWYWVQRKSRIHAGAWIPVSFKHLNFTDAADSVDRLAAADSV